VVVSDITERGARCKASRVLDLPAHVEIASPLWSGRRRARVVWRKGTLFGLEFVPEGKKAG
jgi:hypothetical protein